MQWPYPSRLTIESEHPFVGRRAELETIEAVWDLVEEGRRQVIFIGGEPGAGKTRLIAETATALHENEVTILFGSSFSDYALPYQPFVEILESIFDHAGASVTESIPESVRMLARLTSRAAAHSSDSPLEARDVGRRELFDSFTELVRTLTKAGPVTMVLEDLHWVQEPTRQLLSHLVHTTSEERLLIMGSFRTTAPDRDPQLTKTIAELYRLPGVRRLDLAGLDVADIALLVGASVEVSSRHRMSSAVVLRDLTGGNAFFVGELISHGSLDGSYQPATVVDALETRLGSLSESARSVIELAAVVGDQFDRSTLMAAVENEASLLNGLDEAATSGLIVKVPAEGSTQFKFTHSLTRQAVIEAMQLADRVEAHGRVAKAVERTWPPGPTRHAVLAHHFREANQPDRASEEAVEAAKHAASSLAYEEAAYWYQKAAEGDRADRQEWLLAAAKNLSHAGDFAGARVLYRSLLSDSDPHTVARAALGFEESSFFQGLAGQGAVVVIENALDGLVPDFKDPLYIRLLGRKARALYFEGDPRAAEIAEEAIELAEASGDAGLIATSWLAALNAPAIDPETYTKFDRPLRQAYEWALTAGNRSEILHAAAVLAAMAYLQGDPIAHREAKDIAEKTSAVTEYTFWKAVAAGVTCTGHFIQGDLDLARHIAAETRRKSKQMGRSLDEGPFGLQKFMIEREAGRLEPIRPIAENVGSGSSLWEPGLISLYIELEMFDRAEEVLDRFLQQPLETRRDPAIWGVGVGLVAEAVIALNHRDGAELLRPELVRYSGLNLMTAAMVAALGAADRYIAEIDAMLGLPSAETYFQSALELDRRMGATLHEVESLIAYAAYLERTSDHERIALAAEHRRKARALAEQKGLVRQLRRLDTATTLRSDRPAGLTPREIQVVRLIAEGLSNSDIAERLFISHNTAANHVRNILTKTNASNRTKAAIFAAENGLL